MKQIIEQLIAANSADPMGAWGTLKPTETTVIVKLIDGLLCVAPVWEKSPQQLYSWERDALKYIAWEFEHSTAENPITLTVSLVEYLRVMGLLKSAAVPAC